MNRKLLQNFKTEIILLAAALVVTGAAWFLVFDHSRSEARLAEEEWRSVRQKKEDIIKWKKTGKEIRQVMDLLEDLSHYAQISSAPVELAKKYQLKVPSVNYQKEAAEEGFVRVNFVFSVMGSYEAIRKYISEIEAAKALYVIEDMNLGKSSREGSQLELQMKMSTLIRTGS
ncbi:MAG TPA: type 4a pilus biogenesis protein PilO [Nitrospiria bacterium]|nr:type 4a pilus biogenesis protein PilO [Nitrospiria bacterium]